PCALLFHHQAGSEAVGAGSEGLEADSGVHHPRTRQYSVRRINMTTFRSLASRFSALFRRRAWDRRVDEELQFHLDMQVQENIRRGMTRPEAWAAAQRKLGNATHVCEEVHQMNTISFLEETARNVRVSIRMLHKNPGFALAAVLVLALGLGASTA